MVLLYGMIFTTRAKVGTIQQTYNVTNEINLKVKAKKIYTQDDAKK